MAPDDLPRERPPSYDELHVAIEDFAARYFTIPPAEREALWDRLNAQAGEHPLLAQRLAPLVVGLTLDPTALAGDAVPRETATGDAPVREIVQAVLAAYVLPAPEQAELCRAKGAEFSHARYRLAAETLRQQHPEIAELTPLLAAIPSPAGPAEPSRAAILGRLARPLIYLFVAAAIGYLWFVPQKKPANPNQGRRQNEELVKALQQNREVERGAEILRSIQEEKALFALEPDQNRDPREVVDELLARQEKTPDPELAETIARRTEEMKREGSTEHELAWMRRAEVVRHELAKRRAQLAPERPR